MEEVLKKLGLSETETKMYLALLREGEGTAGHIADEAGVNRRLGYDSLRKLEKKGLVSFVAENEKKIYRPMEPRKLRYLLLSRMEELRSVADEIENLIPRLERYYEEKKEERRIRVLSGKEGIKALFRDELEEGKTIHLIGTPKYSEEILKYFLPSFTSERVRKGILIKGIFDSDMREEVSKYRLIEARFLPEGWLSPVNISIYGEKIGIIFWLRKPMVIMIEDKDAASSFLRYFKMLWKTAEK